MTTFKSLSDTIPMPADGIRVTERPDIEASDADGVFSAVLEAYRREGYEVGRARAIQDALASLVSIVEEFLRQRPDASPELRTSIYSFGGSLEKHLMQLSSDASFVEGGLGI